MSKTIIVVEPHADDAFLSLGGMIENWHKAGRKVKILTVYSGTRKRANDAKSYADAVGVEWAGLGFVEAGKAKVNGPANFEIVPKDSLKKHFWEQDLIRWDEDPVVCLPAGIGGHPEHVLVRDRYVTAPYLNMPHQTIGNTIKRYVFYIDQPYASKLKEQETLNTFLVGRKIVAFNKPGARKWRHIPLFKDQQKFFHFNPAESLKSTFEMLVEGPSPVRL